MKKARRILLIALCILVAMVVFAVSASAEDGEYQIVISDGTFENYADEEVDMPTYNLGATITDKDGGEVALPSGLSWDDSSKTLIMNNYNGNGFLITKGETFNIKLVGENHVKTNIYKKEGDWDVGIGKVSNGDLNISAEAGGKLFISTEGVDTVHDPAALAIRAGYINIYGGYVDLYTNRPETDQYGYMATISGSVKLFGDAELRAVCDGIGYIHHSLFWSGKPIILEGNSKASFVQSGAESNFDFDIRSRNCELNVLLKDKMDTDFTGKYKFSNGTARTDFNVYTNNYGLQIAPVSKSDSTQISEAITGIRPVVDETPVTHIETSEFVGQIAWSEDPAVFGESISYVATITVVPKEGYSVPDTYEVEGATSIEILDENVIRASFPATGLTTKTKINPVIILQAPVIGKQAGQAHFTDQYSTNTMWKDSSSKGSGYLYIKYNETYTCTVTLTAKEGYTFAGIEENSFTVVDPEGNPIPGAVVTNGKNNSVVTISFPKTKPGYELRVTGMDDVANYYLVDADEVRNQSDLKPTSLPDGITYDVANDRFVLDNYEGKSIALINYTGEDTPFKVYFKGKNTLHGERSSTFTGDTSAICSETSKIILDGAEGAELNLESIGEAIDSSWMRPVIITRDNADKQNEVIVNSGTVNIIATNNSNSVATHVTGPNCKLTARGNSKVYIELNEGHFLTSSSIVKPWESLKVQGGALVAFEATPHITYENSELMHNVEYDSTTHVANTFIETRNPVNGIYYPSLVEIAPMTKFEAFGGKDNVVLTWEQAAYADGYYVMWADPNHGKYYKLADIPETGDATYTYTHTQLASDQKNYYKIVPYHSDGAGGIVEHDPLIATGGRDHAEAITSPGVPKVTISNTGSARLTLTMNASPSVEYYKIYEGESAAGPFVEVSNTMYFDNICEWPDTMLTAGKTYYYKVSAISKLDGSETALSNVVSKKVVLNTPILTSVTNDNLCATCITWEPNDLDAYTVDGYEVYRSLYSNKSFTKIATVTSNNYVDTTTAYGKTYYYKVRAIKKVGSTTQASGYSSVLKIKKDTMATPKLANSTQLIPFGPAFTFDSVANADGYEVYRSTSSTTGFKLIDDVTSTLEPGELYGYFDLTALNKTYYYKVRAYNKTDFGKKVYTSYSKVLKTSSALQAPVWDYYDFEDFTHQGVVNGQYIDIDGIFYFSFSDAVYGTVYNVDNLSIEIYKSTDKKKWTKLVDSNTFEAYMDSYGPAGFDADIIPGKTYYYKARYVYDDGTNKVTSAYSSVKTMKAIFASDVLKVSPSNQVNSIVVKPTNLSTYYFDESNTYQWIVERSTSAKSGFQVVYTTTFNNSGSRYLSFEDTDVVAGKTYYYRARVKSTSLVTGRERYYAYTSAKSAKMVPQALTNVYIDYVSPDSIDIMWKAIGCDAEYIVYRSTSKSSGYVKVAQFSEEANVYTGYSDKNAVANKTYYYKVVVRAKSGSNQVAQNSGYSNIVSAKVSIAKPVFTVAKTLLDGKPAVEIAWTTVANADKYEILRSTSSSSGYKVIATIDADGTAAGIGMNYIDQPTFGKTYYYKVVAKSTKAVKGSATSSSKKIAFSQAKPTLKITNSDNHLYIVGLGDIYVDGFEIQTSTNGKTYKLASAVDGRELAEDLIVAQGKTIYVKIRTFVISAGKKIYSAFSSVVKGKAF